MLNNVLAKYITNQHRSRIANTYLNYVKKAMISPCTYGKQNLFMAVTQFAGGKLCHSHEHIKDELQMNCELRVNYI